MAKKLLGIDVGTGGTRAVLMDEAGRVLNSATAEHAPMHSPQIGWAEQDPHDWWRAGCMAVRACLEKSGTSPSEIAAVGLTGQMHGLVLLDADGEVLRPSIIWCDQRTGKQCRADHGAHRRGAADRTDRESGADQFHAAENMVGAAARAGNLVARAHDSAAEGLFPVPANGRSCDRRRGSVRHAFLRRCATQMVEAHAGGFPASARACCRRCLNLPKSAALFRKKARGDGTAGRHSGRRGRRGPGCGRGGNGNRAARGGERDDRNLRRRVCGDQSSGARSAGTHPYVLPRRSGPMARDGRHPGGGTFFAMVSRRIWRGKCRRRRTHSPKILTSD